MIHRKKQGDCLDMLETGQVVVRPGKEVSREEAAVGVRAGLSRLLDKERGPCM